MTVMLEAPDRPSLAFHVVADDGQVVHARVDGQLAHRFQPGPIAGSEPEGRGEVVNGVTVGIRGESPSPGEAHSASDEPLSAAIGRDAYQRRVLLNLSAVTGMDTSGVNWLLTVQKRMDAGGGRLVLHSLSPAVRNMVRVLKLHGTLKVAVDQFDAVQRV